MVVDPLKTGQLIPALHYAVCLLSRGGSLRCLAQKKCAARMYTLNSHAWELISSAYLTTRATRSSTGNGGWCKHNILHREPPPRCAGPAPSPHEKKSMDRKKWAKRNKKAGTFLLCKIGKTWRKGNFHHHSNNSTTTGHNPKCGTRIMQNTRTRQNSQTDSYTYSTTS